MYLHAASPLALFFFLPPNGDDPQRYFCSAAAPMRFPFSCEDAVCAHSWIYTTLLHSKHNRRGEQKRGGVEKSKGRREGGRGGESSYERSRAPWRALVRLDAGRPQVDGSVCTWGGGGSVGMWGDQNDVISKACSIWLDSVVLILSNPVNARSIERNWRIICKSCTVCLSGDLQESHTSQKKKKSFLLYLSHVGSKLTLVLVHHLGNTEKSDFTVIRHFWDRLGTAFRRISKEN